MIQGYETTGLLDLDWWKLISYLAVNVEAQSS